MPKVFKTTRSDGFLKPGQLPPETSVVHAVDPDNESKSFCGVPVHHIGQANPSTIYSGAPDCRECVSGLVYQFTPNPGPHPHPEQALLAVIKIMAAGSPTLDTTPDALEAAIEKQYPGLKIQDIDLWVRRLGLVTYAEGTDLLRLDATRS